MPKLGGDRGDAHLFGSDSVILFCHSARRKNHWLVLEPKKHSPVLSPDFISRCGTPSHYGWTIYRTRQRNECCNDAPIFFAGGRFIDVRINERSSNPPPLTRAKPDRDGSVRRCV